MHNWPVVPISSAQRLDVRSEDILEGGLYRNCNIYRGGGGYDKFPSICKKRIGVRARHQFVVQLQKCVLDCPYCYVTREGVWGKAQLRTTDQLIEAFIQSGQEVFHLMGGAPAIYLNQWPELINKLFEAVPSAIFTSDFLLVEGVYEDEILDQINHPRALYAIDVKGLNNIDWEANTRLKSRWPLFWQNWEKLQRNKVPVYVTFTGVNQNDLNAFWGAAFNYGIDAVFYRKDAYSISIIDYDALPYVDDHKWGLENEGQKNTTKDN